jgi:hypothetical protein
MILQSKDPKNGFKLGNVKLKVSKEKLVSNAGLGTIMQLFDESPLSKDFASCLPERKSNNTHGSYRMALMMLTSLIHGDDCLDDIEKEFSDNPSFEAFFRGKVPVAKTFGDYLRSFDDEHIQKLNQFLTKMGYTIRDHLRASVPEEHRPREKPHYSVDSTPHEQHGSKIEGCDYNYNNLWCLNSEVVFDEVGLAYAGVLQTGNTKPGTHGPALLEQVLKPLIQQKILHPTVRVADVSGDSAYGFEDFIRTAQAGHATFIIAARRNIPWEQQIEKFTDTEWIQWKPSIKEMERFDKKNKELPECCLARWHWSPSWAPQLKFPIIIKKEWKSDPFFEGSGSFHYHAIMTNEDLTKNSYQEIYERYAQRANMENFIKEAKMNFDAYHLPCLSFKANHAFLLLLLVAFNLLRWISVITKPDKPHYAKKLRRSFIFQAGKIQLRSRQVFLKVSEKYFKEVQRLKEAWELQPIKIFPQFSTA